MSEFSSTHGDSTGEVFLISKDNGLYLDAVERIDLATLAWDADVPYANSIKDASKALEALTRSPHHTIGCTFKLDDLQFNEMRSSVLRAGVVVLAVCAGNQAVIAPISKRLPTANWRSEFIFRATRGIRLLKPELSEQELLHIVTSEIQFYEEQTTPVIAGLEAHWIEDPQSDAVAGYFR